MRLGVVGSGSIVPFHLDALQAVGFHVHSIGTRPGSERTGALAERYSVSNVASTWQEVVSSEVDAFLIAPETSVTPEILQAAIATGKPVLVEKPVAYHSAEIDALGTADQVLVGYNRRHYSSTEAASALLRSSEQATFNAAIPESSWTTAMSDTDRRKTLLANSVHVLDLLQYLFGELQIAGLTTVEDGVGVFSKTLALQSATPGRNGQAMITFGSPSNFFVDIHTPGVSASMRPIEFYQEFNGVQVVEPTTEIPLRHYIPTKSGNFELAKADLEFKPGFYSQALELKALVEGNLADRKSATLKEAASALRLAEAILA